jgi:hypothetical protein
MKTKGPPFSITWNLEASSIEICAEIPKLSTNFTELGSTDICAYLIFLRLKAKCTCVTRWLHLAFGSRRCTTRGCVGSLLAFQLSTSAMQGPSILHVPPKGDEEYGQDG